MTLITLVKFVCSRWTVKVKRTIFLTGIKKTQPKLLTRQMFPTTCQCMDVVWCGGGGARRTPFELQHARLLCSRDNLGGVRTSAAPISLQKKSCIRGRFKRLCWTQNERIREGVEPTSNYRSMEIVKLTSAPRRKVLVENHGFWNVKLHYLCLSYFKF